MSIHDIDIKTLNGDPGSLAGRFMRHLCVNRRPTPAGSWNWPSLPPPAGFDRLEQGGWIVRALPELPEGLSPDYLEALAHLRYVLGARVLQDGPAFAPSIAAKTPQPES